MKFSSAFLLALTAAPAAAFQVQPAQSSATQLFSSRQSDIARERAIDERVRSMEDSRGPAIRDSMSTMGGSSSEQVESVWQRSEPIHVQGGSLKTWSFASPKVEQVQVVLKTEGRPLDCDLELWQGPDNTPVKMRVYVEDGSMRPFSALIETPSCPNTVALRNTGQLEFPMAAVVAANTGPPLSEVSRQIERPPRTIQGGALHTYPFQAAVESVQILLKTDGRPLNARIELLQGPNNNKQVVELYTEDGFNRPFYMIVETPGSGNVVRIVNTATVEFPMTAFVDAHTIGSGGPTDYEPVISDAGGFMGARNAW